MLRCQEARFRTPVRLDGVRFSLIDAAGAVFEHGATLSRCRVLGDADLSGASASRLTLDGVEVGGSLFLQAAAVTTFAVEDVEVSDYVSFDQAQIKQLTLRDVTFGGQARFRAVGEACSCTFTRVRFGAEASFQGSVWSNLRLDGCSFPATTDLKTGLVRGKFALLRCQMPDLRRLEVDTRRLCRLDGTTFERPVIVDAHAPEVSAAGAVFERGLDLRLATDARLTLSRASLGGESLITSARGWEVFEPAKLVALDGARLERVTLRGLDLSGCAFADARELESVVIAGDGQLATTSSRLGSIGRREVLYDELRYRESSGQRADPFAVAETYRALRRARESARDRPGAADFYYGEMEMRRLSARRPVDRFVLSAYWLLSGYGLRASRALLAYAALVALLTAGIRECGLERPADLSAVAAYVVASTTALVRPATALPLTSLGAWLEIVARLTGPALIALVVLALRERVRR